MADVFFSAFFATMGVIGALYCTFLIGLFSYVIVTRIFPK